MDDIDKDIERARVGKKRETAYEIIKHSKIPATNLPPLRAKGKIALLNSGGILRWPIDRTIDAHGNPSYDLSNTSTGEQCQCVIDIHGKGTICGKPTTNYCRQCGKQLCFEHYLPENHNCPMVFY